MAAQAFAQGKSPQGQIELAAATCELLSTVLGTAIMCIHTAGLRDFIMKVRAASCCRSALPRAALTNAWWLARYPLPMASPG